MPGAGPNSPGTMADDAAIGTFTWYNVDNAKVSNDTYADVNSSLFTTGESHYLKATNFGFSIPSGATIVGIKVEVEWFVSPSNSWNDKTVKIVKSDGSIGATNKGNDAVITDDPDTYQTYGSDSDLWGESWDDTDINDLDFGVVFSGDCTDVLSSFIYVDHIRITVYYTTAGVDHTHAASDTMTISDSISVKADMKVSLSDTLTIGDSLAAAANYKVALADTLNISDSFVAAAAYKVAVGDTMNISDVMTYIATVPVVKKIMGVVPRKIGTPTLQNIGVGI